MANPSLDQFAETLVKSNLEACRALIESTCNNSNSRRESSALRPVMETYDGVQKDERVLGFMANMNFGLQEMRLTTDA